MAIMMISFSKSMLNFVEMNINLILETPEEYFKLILVSFVICLNYFESREIMILRKHAAIYL